MKPVIEAVGALWLVPVLAIAAIAALVIAGAYARAWWRKIRAP